MKIDFNRDIQPQFAGHAETTLELDVAHYSRENVMRLFAALPANFSALELSNSDLGHETDFTFDWFCESIPESVTDIGLGWNALHNLTTEKITQGFAKLHNAIAVLDLRANNLNARSLAELASLFSSLPSQLTHLDIRNNDFNQLFENLTDEQLAHVFYGIPLSLKEIICEPPLQTRINHFIRQLPEIINTGRRLVFNNLNEAGLLPELADITINYIANCASRLWSRKPQADEKAPALELNIKEFHLR